MFEDISNLGSSDPNVGKAAAFKILQHVSQNKTDLEYLVKRLVNGLESTKIQTRTGCYTTLAVLLRLRKIEADKLFEFMQKTLVTNKQSSKKERRLIYIARILCGGSILKSFPAAELIKQDEGLLQSILHELIDLGLKKSGYLQLVTPFLAQLLADNTLSQDAFDRVVWPEIKCLFGSGKKKRKTVNEDDEDQDDEEEEEEEEEQNDVNLVCCVQLALGCRNGGYKSEFECLQDVQRIVKSFLVCRFQFEEFFVKSMFKAIRESKEDVELFWNTIMDSIKPTQFDLLCVCVEAAVTENLPLGCVISKRLVRMLLGVFKTNETGFHTKAVSSIKFLLTWDRGDDSVSQFGKKERKLALKCLFGGDGINLLHEYKRVSTVVRGFICKLSGKELEVLRNVILENLGGSGFGVRMGVVYINFLCRVAVCSKVEDNTFFEIVKFLYSLAVGIQSLGVKGRDGDEEFNEEEAQAMLRTCARDCVKSVFSSSYNLSGVALIWEHFRGVVKESLEGEIPRVFKDVKKVLKHVTDVHFRYLICAYALRAWVDEKQVLASSLDGVKELIGIGKEVGGGEEGSGDHVVLEIVKFVVGRVVRDLNPVVDFEAMFLRFIIEGRVREDVVQELASAIDIDFGDGADDDMDEDEDDDEEDEDNDSNEDDDGDAAPASKVPKLDPAQIAKLKETFGDGDSDSEESIPLEDATSEDLERMDGALAKVFAIKKVAKEEDNSNARSLLRSLRLIEMYVGRSVKTMPVGAFLILLTPIVNCLKGSLKMRKFGDVTSRVIGVIDQVCRVRKFEGVGDVEDGVIGGLGREVFWVGRSKRYRAFRELMEELCLVLFKCYLGKGGGGTADGKKKGKKRKKDEQEFLDLFIGAVDEWKGKVGKRRKRKVSSKVKNGGSSGGVQCSRFVNAALDIIRERGWGKRGKEIETRINSSSDGVAE